MKKIFLVLLALALAACSGVGAKSEVDTNLDKWQNASIDHYRFDLSLVCFCPDTDRLPLHIEVQGGEVVSMTYDDGTPVTPEDLQFEFFSTYATIDRIFAQLKADLGGEADEVTVAYDPTYGFPTEIAIDRIKNAIDDELSVGVSNFEVLE